MHTVYLALGSNMGDKKSNIEHAIEFLREQIDISATAALYETKPVGHAEQGNFLNTALKGTTELSPITLLEFVKKIEKSVGRQERFKWGPREIDIDILFYDDLVYEDERLEIPHPRLAERDFVLVPLAEIAADFVHPKLGKTIAALAAELPPENKSVIGKMAV